MRKYNCKIHKNGIMKMNQSQEKQDGEKLCYQNNFVCV